MIPGHRHRLAHHLAEQAELVLERESSEDRTERNAMLLGYARRLRCALEVAMEPHAANAPYTQTGEALRGAEE